MASVLDSCMFKARIHLSHCLYSGVGVSGQSKRSSSSSINSNNNNKQKTKLITATSCSVHEINNLNA